MKLLNCLIAAALAASFSASAEPITLQLRDGWRAGPDSAKLNYKAKVPSTAMGVLMDNGVYPANLLEGLNLKNVDASRFDRPWFWETEFQLPKLSDTQRATLQLDGVSYRADVYVNGKRVASSDSIFGPYRRHFIDITPYVNGKKNKLTLKIHRAQPGEPNIGFVDWNPRPADESMGPFRPVSINITDAVSISNPVVKSKIDKQTLKEAWLTVEATLTNNTDSKVDGYLTGTFDGKAIKRHVVLRPHQNLKVTMTPDQYPDLNVKNPRLWWVHNMGKPELYTMDLKFTDKNGKVCDDEKIRFGIREVEEYLTSDNQKGFKLNGRPVLLRGAGWTDDIFLRNDSASYRTEAEMVRDMNLNTVRFENIWGTDDYIYDLCDELGLLVLTGWTCHWEWDNYIGGPCDEYGGIKTEADQQLMARSLNDQVTWLRNHPSIIGWFVGSDMIPRPELEKKYLEVLSRIDDRPYISAAKEMTSTVTGPSGTKMAGPYDYVTPNYWYDSQAPGGNWGWNTETGIGANMPQRESVIRMLGRPVNVASYESILADSVANYHCTKAGDMNHLRNLTNAINGHYGQARDFEDYMHKADLINYDGTRTMVEAFRVGIPRATGIIQWMLNSAWPSLYWQLYDHYLVPTAAYYSLKNSNEPLQLIYDYGKKAVMAVNETNQSRNLTAVMERFPMLSDKAAVTKSPVRINPYEVVKVFDCPDPESLDFTFLTLKDDKGNKVAENFYVLSSDASVNDFSKSDWFMTVPTHYADFKALNDLPDVKLESNTQRKGDTVTVTLHNPGKTVSFFNRLAALDNNGQLISPAFWSDNYLTLRPGETRMVTCRLPAADTAFTLLVDGWNQAK